MNKMGNAHSGKNLIYIGARESLSQWPFRSNIWKESAKKKEKGKVFQPEQREHLKMLREKEFGSFWELKEQLTIGVNSEN